MQDLRRRSARTAALPVYPRAGGEVCEPPWPAIAHVFVQRAELAYRDFIRAFGDRVQLPRPTAIYLLKEEATKDRISAAYIGLAGLEIDYGGGITRLAGGYPYNCCAISLKKHRDELTLHARMRHLLGHRLISCWVKVSGTDRYLPRWVFAGAGHGLSRRPEMLADRASSCAGEGSVISDDGEGWAKKVKRYAARRTRCTSSRTACRRWATSRRRTRSSPGSASGIGSPASGAT